MCCQIKGFRKRIRDGEFQIIRGKYKTKNYLDEDELDYRDNYTEYHLIPVPNGSKRSGVLKVVLGIAMIGIGWAAVGAAHAVGAHSAMWMKSLIMGGAGMVLNGVSQMISPAPSLDNGTSEGAATAQSFVFSSAQNVAEEGNIIPVVYGKFWTGSLVLSAGMKPVLEDLGGESS